MSENPFKKIPKTKISPSNSLKDKVLREVAFKQTVAEICSLFTVGYVKTFINFTDNNNQKINND